MNATYTVTQAVKTNRGPHVRTWSVQVSVEFVGNDVKFSGSDWYAGSEIKVEGVAKFAKQYVTAGQTYRVYKFGKASILVRA